MKIYISRYRDHWISPYTILERIFFWTDWSKCARWTLTQSLEDERREKSQYVEHPAWVDRWADRIEPISRAVQWVLDRIHPRIEYVKIDPWDTWSMDHTLGQIALPMLKQLQATKHGSPLVDDEDVPEHLRSTAAPPKQNEWDTDDNHHARWDWVMAEMIFAFEHHLNEDWKDAYHSGNHDLLWVPVDQAGNEVPKGQHKHYQMKRGPNDTYQCDYEGMKVVEDRIQNGFRLWGKYFTALWD